MQLDGSDFKSDVLFIHSKLISVGSFEETAPHPLKGEAGSDDYKMNLKNDRGKPREKEQEAN